MSGPFTGRTSLTINAHDCHPCHLDNTLEERYLAHRLAEPLPKHSVLFGTIVVANRASCLRDCSREIHDERASLRVHDAHGDECAEKQASAKA